ncbi:HAD-IIIC family phosphatase [Streptomyces sp. WAC05374]|uniref:HAD-IIIC family phosphatase n=1 Tax=Streptomyces sp. WAC05374 TaxID=2487420 RepID=UPI000F87D780|nr:HAD-IIIC family phosphatase [Streptomyces sp. WAC05374]RST18380.1 HAD-IIIC family phosphatase [Streptomyces sp. WAC05374]TDF36204.1 HAD-IIIC family phosphatase [Streptomyces sp. WAC05374]TDF45722.1 HAD-IIIC family phosphatase [Streptomyces sp. WAC05374]TDF46649.1 HAD-IIIC family phosphatase [Streptomyces sp. WAC05374]
MTTTAVTTVKCVVWDLDNTVWDGVLLEDGDVTLRPAVVDVIRTLDERGILHSVASRNDHDAAMAKLEEFGIAEYFLHPQINWGNKSDSVRAVAEAFNIGIDTLAFVDDQPFERDEVRFAHERVLCIDALDAEAIPGMPQMQPRFVTADSRERRHLYRADVQRQEAQDAHHGTDEEFLASLGMRFTIAPAQERDLQRAEELTVRTNQLNATGYTYSYEELDAFRRSPDHDLLVAGLEDKYGTYGKIGLALVERGTSAWTVKLLLMSCRVMSRGVGSVLLGHLIRSARDAGVTLRAEFVPTSRNRTMYVTYKFAGFREVAKNGDVSVLEHDGTHVQGFPPYMDVTVER